MLSGGGRFAGAFDTRGWIKIEKTGRVKLRIAFPGEHMAYMAKGVFGGSVYRVHWKTFGASWAWEVSSRATLAGLLPILARYSRGQETPLRIAYLFVQEAWERLDAIQSMTDFYKGYYTNA